MVRSLPVGVCLGLWLCLLPAIAQAQAARPALELGWSAPAECPQQARARRLIAEYLGERDLPASAGDARVLRARASIQKRAQRWELRLETLLDGQPGERTLAASTCADVAAAAALVLAFAIDPGAALKHGAPPAAPPAPAPAAPPPPPPPRATPTYFGASGSVRYGLGALPGGSAGATLGVMVEHGPWSGMLLGTGFAERNQSAPDRPSAGGEFWLWAVAAAPCWAPAHRETLRLRVCLPLELQRVHARGYGVDVRIGATGTELLLGPELTPGLGLSPRLELIAPLGLGVALRRPEFYLERISTVFRGSLLQVRLGLGLQARF